MSIRVIKVKNQSTLETFTGTLTNAIIVLHTYSMQKLEL